MNYPDCPDPNSFENGLEFQDYVIDALRGLGIIVQTYASKSYQYRKGESAQGVEIKLDSRCTETGRLSIEIAEKTTDLNKPWIPSGIYRSDNTWLYVQGNRHIVFVFPKNVLLMLHKSGKYEEAETLTVKKFYLPMKLAERYAAKVLRHKDNSAN